ncbi:hypothetical protein PoB_006576000 [Plakobranchus ocellatus]|uniref:Uncharacterized protein n=1 Tax=Plakobranchus ocellatus TaxID=259542 RepID=A0AAV4D5H7_9GAST|nr:hypothetical protein PoB_006576000 [Plakobranchus ocellatus]
MQEEKSTDPDKKKFLITILTPFSYTSSAHMQEFFNEAPHVRIDTYLTLHKIELFLLSSCSSPQQRWQLDVSGKASHSLPWTRPPHPLAVCQHLSCCCPGNWAALRSLAVDRRGSKANGG